MAVALHKLWFGMSTSGDPFGVGDHGTDDNIVLQVTRNDSVDIFNFTFGDTSQDDQEAGFANVYELVVDNLNAPQAPKHPIVPEEIQAIRVGITGSDAWSPADLVVWGERPAADRNRIVPLAIALAPTMQALFTHQPVDLTLSTDLNEGVISFTIRPVGLGQVNTTIDSLILMTITEDTDNAGTGSPISLSITVDETTFVDAQLQEEAGNPRRGGANLYRLHPSPFSKGRLKPDSIRLSIHGDDAWKPQNLFLFGLDPLVPDEESRAEAGRPTVLVPLVHIDPWNLGTLSTDPNEGVPSVVLPLVE